MSQGARNWPFLTLTTRPVAAAATSRSVWRQRKAGICRTSTTSATRAHCCASCTSVRIGNAELLADLGEDRQRAVEADAARALGAGAVRLVERGLVDEADAEPCRRSPSAPRPSPARGRGFPARTAPRSARAAAHCRSALADRNDRIGRGLDDDIHHRATMRRAHSTVNRGARMGELARHIGRAHRAIVAERHQHRKVSAIESRAAVAESQAAASRSDRAPPCRPRGRAPACRYGRRARAPVRRRASRERRPRRRRSGGLAAARPCRLRPWWRAARSWCRRRYRCRGRHAPGAADRARRAGETGRCRGTGSRSDSAQAPCRSRGSAAKLELVQMDAVGEHRAPADQPIMGVDVEIVAPLADRAPSPTRSRRGSPRCGSA